MTTNLGWLRNLADGCGYASDEIEGERRIDERIAALTKELAEAKKNRKANTARVEKRILTQWTPEEIAAAKEQHAEMVAPELSAARRLLEERRRAEAAAQ